MFEKFENFVEIVFSSFSRKRIFFLIAVIFFFFVFQSKIENFIEAYLLINRNFSNTCLDILLLLTSVYSSIFFFYKIFKDRYVPSYNEIIVSLFFVFYCFYYLLKTSTLNWDFTSLKVLNMPFKYIYFILIPIIVFITSFSVRFLYDSFFLSKIKASVNFSNDSAIDDINEDELDYHTIVNKLTDVLKNHDSEKSFTIGLVGPWGNGKSSIIKMVSSQLKPKISFFKTILNYLKFGKNNNTIIINFLPYLNHKEEDIISEFFTSLSKELSYFNGKLANQILEYSKRLTNIYNENQVVEFFENVASKSIETPSKNLYDDINIRLGEIGKKIIVFVDDLDRLNDSEILEVLKLIRNTADFNNTIFVVAMDKDYVINRLKANNEILDSKFIDKFFQLEILLPELETKTLREYFIKLLLKSNLASISNFEERLNFAIKNKYNLFDLYVKNLRDVKRIANQIIFEYPFFESELDLKDFMNFTYFKLKFPQLIKILNDNRNTLLKMDRSGQFYQLPMVKPSDSQKLFNRNQSKETVIVIDKFKSLDKYKIYEELKAEDLTVKDFINIEKDDLDLLLKTLVSLFGEENEIENNHSIKFENNFRKLMQQKFLTTDLLESEYQLLFLNADLPLKDLGTPYDLPYDLINVFFEQHKLNELLKRFDYFNSNSIPHIKWSILILGMLYEKRVDYQLDEIEILRLLHAFVDKRIELNTDNKAVGTWLLNNMFEEVLSLENKLLLYGEIWHRRKDSHLWDIKREYFESITLEAFKEYVEQLKEQKINFDNYSIYNVYHSIKLVGGIENEIKQVFISLWNDENIEVLCVQMTQFAPFTGSGFTISDFASEIFQTNLNFINFVQGLITEKNKISIIQFLMLFNLCAITDFSKYILFKFRDNSMMIARVTKELDNNKLKKMNEEKKIQVFYETNDGEIINKIIANESLKNKYEMSAFAFKEKHYLLVVFDEKNARNNIELVFPQEMLRNVIPSTSWEQKPFTLSNVLHKKPFYTSGEKYIEVFSIQPPIV